MAAANERKRCSVLTCKHILVLVLDLERSKERVERGSPLDGNQIVREKHFVFEQLKLRGSWILSCQVPRR
jgi:hypothetical protein